MASCPIRRAVFPKSSSNISYLVKSPLKFYFCREHPILFIFSHYTKLMPVEAKKAMSLKNSLSAQTWKQENFAGVFCESRSLGIHFMEVAAGLDKVSRGPSQEENEERKKVEASS